HLRLRISLPTRRSSDLQRAHHGGRSDVTPDVEKSSNCPDPRPIAVTRLLPGRQPLRIGEFAEHHGEVEQIWSKAVVTTLDEQPRDRKSTRLNSSHVKIS